MRKKIFLFIVFALLIIGNVSAQNKKYWVFLNNKKDVTFNPYNYFDNKTIERRIKFNIPIIDSTDFPINSEYFTSIKNIADSVSTPSRWFNALPVYANVNQIEKILNLSFVDSVSEMQSTVSIASINNSKWDTTLTDELLKTLVNQIESMAGNIFIKAGIDGRGVRIAVFDAGFPTVDNNPAFEHIRKEGRIIKTWDFAKNNEFVYDYNSHGTMVLSCIAGILNGRNIGLATGAEFLLARTEVNSEPFSEEENWLAAMEWADKNGADIINSSLGYTYHRYFNFQMNGKHTLVTRAANMAARKGMLVVNAAGNDGDNKWKIIGAPADADSVLSVGGIYPDTDFHTSFSSYGPTWDRRLKPNVCAYGHVAAAGKNKIVSTQGTSFASPLVAGFAACVFQKNKDFSNMQLFKELEKSGDLYPYFDYAHGYGVPQASYFIDSSNVDSSYKSFEFIAEGDFVIVNVSDEFFKRNNTNSIKYLYYNTQQENGVLIEYNVVSVFQKDAVKIDTEYFCKGQKLNVHLDGYTNTFEFK